MNHATIFVKYVNQPDKIPDLGSIKDSNGKYWNVPKNMLGIFVPDTQYEVGYTDTTAKNGRVYSTIKEVGGTPSEAPPAGGHKCNGARSTEIGAQALFKAVWPTWVATGDGVITREQIRDVLKMCAWGYDQTFNDH